MKRRIQSLLPYLAATCLLMFAAAGCSRSAKLARHTARGDEYVQKEQFAKAEIEYLNALRLSPTNAALHRKIALLCYEQGRTITAIKSLISVKNRFPDDPQIHFALASLASIGQDYKGAREHALFVCTNQPTNAAALLMLAEISFSPPEVAETRRIIDQAAQKTGVNGGTHIALAALELHDRNFPAVEEQLKRAAALKADQPSLDLAWGKLRLVQTNLAEADVLLKRAADASPARSISRLQWIDSRIARGDLAAAKQSAEEITRKCPDYIPPWVRLAEIALQERRFEDCDAISKKVLGLDPGSYEALLVRSQLWTAQDKIDKALEDLNRLDALHTNSPGTKCELAVAYARSGNTAKAMALLSDALRINPRFSRATLIQAELNLQTANPGAAVGPLTALLKEQPDLKKAAFLLARAYEMQGRRDAALGIYRQMTARYPQDPELPTLTGVLLLRNRDFPGARAAFETSLQRSPTFLSAIEHLIDLDIRATNYPAALARGAKLAAAVTNSAAGYLMEAKVYGAAKDFKSAEETLQKALDREPNSAAVYSLFATFYYETKNYDKALQKLDAVLARNPKATLAWLQKGSIYQVRGENEKAKQTYRDALAVNSNFTPAMNNLANLLGEEPKHLDEAIEWATRAHDVEPRNLSVSDTLGWLLYKRRDFVGARRLLGECAEQIKNGEVDYHLALTDYALYDEPAAREHFERALQRNLPEQFRPDVQNRLAILNTTEGTPKDIERLEAAIKGDASDFIAQVRLGAIYQKQGNVSKAKSIFENAARTNPQSGAPLNALARLYTESDPARAFQYAKDARKLAPTDPDIAATLGSLSVRQRDFQAAFALLQEATRSGRSSAAVQYDMAVAQYALGRVADASASLAALSKADDARVAALAKQSLELLNGTDLARRSSAAQARLKTDPNDLFALVAQAETEQQQNRVKDAVAAYEKVIGAAPDFWPARKPLAVLYAEQMKDLKSAYPHALKARAASPTDLDLAQLMGKLALDRGDLPDAVRFLEETTRSRTTNGEPYYLLGVANLRLKRTNDCRLALSKALERPLDPALATDAKKIMASLK